MRTEGFFKKNLPKPYPHGAALEAIFDRIHSGVSYAVEIGDFAKDRLLIPNKQQHYLARGNDVYREEDAQPLLSALDMRNAGINITTDRSGWTPEFAQRMDFYLGYRSEVEAVITAGNLCDDYGYALTFDAALKDYGTYRWQQIDRFDKRQVESGIRSP